MSDAFAFDQLTISGEVIALDSKKASQCSTVFLTVENAPIRFRFDGGNPTPESGHLLSSGDTLRLEGPSNVQSLRVIAATEEIATLIATYEE